MLTLIIGGASSGKSRYAESMVQTLPGKRIYLATMQPSDGESIARVAKHRAQRKGKHFETIECYTNLSVCKVRQDDNVLLEDLANLLANELFSPEGKGVEAVNRGIKALQARCAHLTIVSNEVFSVGNVYEGETLHFLKDLAQCNRYIAQRADLVVEMVCGIPNILKRR